MEWVTFQLLMTYKIAGKRAEAVALIPAVVARGRKATKPDSLKLGIFLANVGWNLLKLEASAEAEPLIRECLAIREKIAPDTWSAANARSMLGGALLGLKKFAEAEPLLIAGYEGLKHREKTIPPEGATRITEALDRLIELYTATNKLDEAKKWRAERAKYPFVAQPPREN